MLFFPLCILHILQVLQLLQHQSSPAQARLDQHQARLAPAQAQLKHKAAQHSTAAVLHATALPRKGVVCLLPLPSSASAAISVSVVVVAGAVAGAGVPLEGQEEHHKHQVGLQPLPSDKHAAGHTQTHTSSEIENTCSDREHVFSHMQRRRQWLG